MRKLTLRYSKNQSSNCLPTIQWDPLASFTCSPDRFVEHCKQRSCQWVTSNHQCPSVLLSFESQRNCELRWTWARDYAQIVKRDNLRQATSRWQRTQAVHSSNAPTRETISYKLSVWIQNSFTFTPHYMFHSSCLSRKDLTPNFIRTLWQNPAHKSDLESMPSYTTSWPAHGPHWDPST